MGAGIAAFACGTILLYFSGLTPVVAPGVALVLALPALALPWRRPRVLILLLLAGLGWAGWNAGQRLQQTLPPALEGEPVSVSGHLCSIPAPGAWNSVRFSFCVTAWHLDSGQQRVAHPARLPRKLRLAWYGDAATGNIPVTLRLKVVLKRPHGAVNPAGFRYETWLFRQGYRATGTVRELVPDMEPDCGVRCHYQRWRNGLARELAGRLEHMNHRPLAQSLLLGYRGDMTPEHWRVLEATGTIHLVAISGLHLGLIATAAGALGRRLLLHLPPAWLVPRRRRLLVLALVLLLALAYALVAGFTVPTRRALVMVAIAGWLAVYGRLRSAWQGWLLALGLVLVADPFSPLDQGFWLSFGAVAVLLLVFARRLRPPSPVTALVLAQAAVFAGLWPVLAVLDQPSASLGLVANLLAIPWLALVVMPVLLAGALLLPLAPSLNGWIGGVYDLALTPLWWLLETLAEIPVPAVAGGPVSAAAGAALVLTALLVPSRSLRLLVIAVILVWLGVALQRGLNPGNSVRELPELWIWDVGQGLSVLLHHGDQVLLYDTGPESGSGYSAADSVLDPNLARLGIGRLDTLVLSHGDRDHAGGLAHLRRRFAIGRVISGEPDRLQARFADTEPCIPGTSWRVGEVVATLWHRNPAGHDEAGATDNNDASCVVILRYGVSEIVLPGDISRALEMQLLTEFDFAARARRLVVAPHHGSKTSSGRQWVEHFSGATVVFTAGYRHRYGHPHPEVVARYREAGSDLHNTAFTGALRLRLGPGGPVLTRWRDQAPFWIRPAPDNE